MANAATYSRYHTDTTSSLSSRLVMVLCDEDTEDEQGSSIHSSVLSPSSMSNNKMESFPASRVDGGDSSLASVTNGHTVETVSTRFPSLFLEIQQTTNPTNPRGYTLGLLIRDSSSSSHLIDSLCSKYPSVEYTRADPWGSDIVQLSLKSAATDVDVDPLIKFATELSQTDTQIRAAKYWNIEIDSIDLTSLKNKGFCLNLHLK